MNLTPEGQQRYYEDLALLKDPSSWPYDFLPLKRTTQDSGSPDDVQCGMFLGLANTGEVLVFHANPMELSNRASEGEDFALALARVVVEKEPSHWSYDTIEGILSDGWEID